MSPANPLPRAASGVSAALPSRRERRRSRAMSAVLEAAERHLLERGYEDAKVDTIAGDADVAVGSIYNYFGSKEGLYAALLERALERFELYMGEDRELELSALEQVLDTAGRLAPLRRRQPPPPPPPPPPQ